MSDKTKIDWADASWNPVTGCYHRCKYCYAQKIATRFAGFLPEENPGTWGFRRGGTIVELDGMQARQRKDGKIVPAFFPFGFTPTLHKYRLNEPTLWRKPRNIFVCSVADLFGEWVPDEWIQDVFRACEDAPQHRYLFLTKNPKRYESALDKYMPPNMWFGWSQTAPLGDKAVFSAHHSVQSFVSIEPLLAPFHTTSIRGIGWVIVGAETGNRKGKVIPMREWVEEIAEACAKAGVPLFMKDSLKGLMGDDFIQQYPWNTVS